MEPDSARHYIRASDVGEFAFCARAWWLHRVRGIPYPDSKRLAIGRTQHYRHGMLVTAAIWARKAGVGLLIAALALAALLFAGG
jgi:hypothetical protein